MTEGKALDRQIGGNHYDGGMQPVEFAMLNHYDACSFSVLKYLHRHKQKNGIVDLRKAAHFVELREEIGSKDFEANHLRVIDYIESNTFCDWTEDCIRALAVWARHPTQGTARKVVANLKLLALEEYGETL
jgi:hypothetical protein